MGNEPERAKELEQFGATDWIRLPGAPQHRRPRRLWHGLRPRLVGQHLRRDTHLLLPDPGLTEPECRNQFGSRFQSDPRTSGLYLSRRSQPTAIIHCPMAWVSRHATIRSPADAEAWNLTVQQQFNSSMSLQVAYVGSHGLHNMFDSSNQASPNQQTIGGFNQINPETGLTYTQSERRPCFDGTAQRELGVNYGHPLDGNRIYATTQRGDHQLPRVAGGRGKALQPGSAVPLQLHVVPCHGPRVLLLLHRSEGRQRIQLLQPPQCVCICRQL